MPCKRTAEQTTTDLELEDDAELDALAAKCALPSKKARLEPFQHFDATHSSSLSTAAPPKSASAATAHRFSALNVDLGVHVSPLQPVQAKTFEGHSLTFKRRRVQAQQVTSSFWAMSTD